MRGLLNLKCIMNCQKNSQIQAFFGSLEHILPKMVNVKRQIYVKKLERAHTVSTLDSVCVV